MLTRKANPKKKKKLAQWFKTWPKTKGKICFGLGRKNIKFEKYTNFKPFKLHLIHSTAHVTAKMKCGEIMILAKL